MISEKRSLSHLDPQWREARSSPTHTLSLVVGLFLFLFSFPVLISNEFKAAKIWRLLEAGKKRKFPWFDVENLEMSWKVVGGCGSAMSTPCLFLHHSCTCGALHVFRLQVRLGSQDCGPCGGGRAGPHDWRHRHRRTPRRRGIYVHVNAYVIQEALCLLIALIHMEEDLSLKCVPL